MALGFKSQSMLLADVLFRRIRKIQEPLYTPEQAPAGTANKDFLRDFVGNLLQTAFPNLQV
jgi:exportin-1